MKPQNSSLAPTGSLAYSPAEAASALRVSQWAVYRAVQSGELPHVRIGRHIRIPHSALLDFVEPPQLPDGAA